MSSNGWKKIELGNIAFVTKLAGFEYTKHLSNNFQDKGVPVIQGRNIKNRSLNFDSIKYISKELSDSLARSRVNFGDILFSYVGTVGDIYLHDSDKPLHLGSNVAKISILNENEVCNKFLYYTLQGIESINKISSKTKGTVQSNINMGDLRSIEINLPPANEQKVIAATLSCLDDMIESNKRTNQVLEEVAQAIFKHWFMDFEFPNDDGQPYKSSGGKMVDSDLGEIPNGWNRGCLGDIAKQNHSVCQRNNIPFGSRYVGLEHIPRKQLILNECGTIEDVTSDKLRFEKYNILFGKIRPYFHKVSISPWGGYCSTDAIVLSPISEDFYQYMCQTLFSEAFIKFAVKVSQGTKMPRSEWKVLKNYSLVVPPVKVAKYFNSIVNPMIQKMIINNQENNQITKVRNTLLPKLMSGEIRVAFEGV